MTLAAKDVWGTVVSELKRLGLLNVVEVQQLRCYCEAVVVHNLAVKDVEEHGITILGGMTGMTPVKNPAWNVQRESAMLIRAFAIEFGLTPAARAHVQVPESTGGGVADFFN